MGKETFILSSVLFFSSVSFVIAADNSAPVNGVQSHSRYYYAGIVDKKGMEFFKKFQKLVAQNKRENLSDLLHYPVTYVKNGHEYQLKDKNDFLNNYKDIFTKRIKEIVAQEKEKDLFISWRGVMFGRGEIWCGGVDGGDVKVFSFNTELSEMLKIDVEQARKVETPLKTFSDEEKLRVWLIGDLKRYNSLKLMKGYVGSKGVLNINYDDSSKILSFVLPANHWWFGNKFKYSVNIFYDENEKQKKLALERLRE